MTGGDLDCISDKNCAKDVTPCQPVVIPELVPSPEPWDGNFAQMDVAAVAEQSGR